MESDDSEKIRIQNVTPIKCTVARDADLALAEESLVDKYAIADERKSALEDRERNINNVVACDSTISVKGEVMENLELDIKEDPSQDGSIDTSDYVVNTNGLRSYVKVEGNNSTGCAIESTAPKECFASCNVCLKAFYRGFVYNKSPNARTTVNWKCSERNRGCRAEICIFLYSKFFMEIEGHTCTLQEDNNSPLVFDDVLLMEQGCTSPQRLKREVRTRYVPLKNVIYCDREKIADIDPTTIAYYKGMRMTVAVHMGYEYRVRKHSTYWFLQCSHASCPGLLRVLKHNRAIAKITDHTCDINTDSIDINVPIPGHFKVLHYTDQVFTTCPPDIPDDALAYYCKFISGYRKNVVLFRHHHYLYSTWTNQHSLWKCEHPSCHATLKITKNNTEFLLVGDHNCENLSGDPEIQLEKNYHPVKVFEYTDYDVNYEVESQVGMLPQLDPNDTNTVVFYYKEIEGYRRRVMHYMGCKYRSGKWGKLYSSWTCLNTSCSATTRILHGKKGIMAVGQHTCDKFANNDKIVTAGLIKLKNAKSSRLSEKHHLDKRLSKSYIRLEANGNSYIYNLGYLYEVISNKDNLLPCIHRDAFGCRALLNFNPRQSGVLVSAFEHNCFHRSRNVENLMFLQRRFPGDYAYFSGYVYRRSRMLYELHQTYKWVCVVADCNGVLTTKFNEVLAESTHVCREPEECRGEAECTVVSDDSDEGSAQKKIKTE